MKQYPIIILFFVLLILTGCRFKVENTDGINAALQDLSQAEIVAYELKYSGNLNSEQLNKVKVSYNNAVAKVNGYLNGIKVNVRSTYVVNVPLDNYKNSEASTAVKEFLDLAEPMRTPVEVALGPITGAAASSFALSLVNQLLDLNDNRNEEAYKRFSDELDKYMAVPFDLVTAEHMTRRYSS